MDVKKQPVALIYSFGHIIENECSDTGNLFSEAMKHEAVAGETRREFLNFMGTNFSRSNVAESASVDGYVEKTIPLYSLDHFRSHFRMTRTTFQVCLCCLLIYYICITWNFTFPLVLLLAISLLSQSTGLQ